MNANEHAPASRLVSLRTVVSFNVTLALIKHLLCAK